MWLAGKHQVLPGSGSAPSDPKSLQEVPAHWLGSPQVLKTPRILDLGMTLGKYPCFKEGKLPLQRDVGGEGFGNGFGEGLGMDGEGFAEGVGKRVGNGLRRVWGMVWEGFGIIWGRGCAIPGLGMDWEGAGNGTFHLSPFQIHGGSRSRPEDRCKTRHRMDTGPRFQPQFPTTSWISINPIGPSTDQQFGII